MARILVVEPHLEVRELLVRVVGRLGHDAVPETGTDPLDVDLVLVEPEAWGAAQLARRAHEKSGATVLCISVALPTEESRALEPVAHMVKPFGLAELERAILGALAGGQRAVA